MQMQRRLCWSLLQTCSHTWDLQIEITVTNTILRQNGHLVSQEPSSRSSPASTLYGKLSGRTSLERSSCSHLTDFSCVITSKRHATSCIRNTVCALIFPESRDIELGKEGILAD